jgi:histone acetyltransferase 1
MAQEVLMQLEKPERLAKLEETFLSVCEDYRRILAMAL